MILLTDIYPIKEYLKMINLIIEGAVKSPPSTADITKAINKRRYVGIYYSDPTDSALSGFRMIEPYVLGAGFKKRNGEVINANEKYLRAYVVIDTSKDELTKDKFKKKGSKRKSVSKSGKALGWRLFRVDKIKTWQDLERKFSTNRPLYNPSDKMMGSIIASA